MALGHHSAVDCGPLYRGVAGTVDAVNVQIQPLAAIDSLPSPAGAAQSPPLATTAGASAFRRLPTTTVRAVGAGTASSSGHGGGVGLPRSGHRITGMLLVVSFSYVGCLLPLVVLSLVIHVAVLTDRDLAQRLFVALDDCQRIFEFISELNYAANFYIYVLSGAQFRHALRRVLCRCSRFSGTRRGRRAAAAGGRYGDDVRPVALQRKKPVAFGGGGGGGGGGSSSGGVGGGGGGGGDHRQSDQQQQQQRSRQSPRQNANVFHFRQFNVDTVSPLGNR